MKLKTLLFTVLFLLYTTSLYAAQATLSWNPNSESDLAGYKVYYGNSSGSYSTEKDVGNVTSYVVKDLKEGEIYFFVATAYDFSGNESGYSNEVSYDIPITSVPDTTEPVLTLLGDSPMTVERGTVFTDPGVTAIDAVDGDITDTVEVSGDIIDATKEGTYYITYTVTDKALNTASINRVVKVVDTTPPTVPQGMGVTGTDAISWNPNSESDLEGYVVDRDGKFFAALTETYIVIKGRNKHKDWKDYYVKAYDTSGNISNPSDTIRIKFRRSRIIQM